MTTTQRTDTSGIVTSERVDDLRNDVLYLDRLTELELEAAKASKGLWSNPHMTETDRGEDVLKEAQFQTTAPWYQKLWRRLRGG